MVFVVLVVFAFVVVLGNCWIAFGALPHANLVELSIGGAKTTTTGMTFCRSARSVECLRVRLTMTPLMFKRVERSVAELREIDAPMNTSEVKVC